MKRLLVVLSLLTGLFMAAGCTNSKAQKEGTPSAIQRNYLDEHEEEMSYFVRSYNEDEIHSVKFWWDTAKVRNVPDGTLFGAGYVISLEGTFNDDKHASFKVAIWLDDDGNPDIDKMYFIRNPVKGQLELDRKSSE